MKGNARSGGCKVIDADANAGSDFEKRCFPGGLDFATAPWR